MILGLLDGNVRMNQRNVQSLNTSWTLLRKVGPVGEPRYESDDHEHRNR